MRLNCYPHPIDGLWISPSNLASALKEGEADLCIYGVEVPDNFKPTVNASPLFLAAFRRLIWHNGLRIKQAVARELKWLGISLLFCWLPLRHWLEPRIGKGYLFVAGFLTVMIVGALLEIALCLYERNSLPKRFEKFKISTIRHFSARPRPPVSRTIDASNQDSRTNLKFWAVFLIICLAISSIVPVRSSWVVVHPLGGQDYLTSGPALMRPFSSWRAIPKTHRATIWGLLSVSEAHNTVMVLELTVEWQVTDPLKYRPRDWHLILDRAVGMYVYSVIESLAGQAALQYPELTEKQHKELAIEQMMIHLETIATVIQEQIGSPMPMRIISIKIKTVSLTEYSNYYQKVRKR